ncbi:CPBP family intramembrane glutamic endopeptidase [Edaphobacter sp. 12200R-103]|jgi:membrane protease YdiL (CAAX protease family)|uniref:CPBP family intramembrane glutamic endopeptidase n=1 Tax=Edaphobacter sp. 12200R-103 TaxID=2703788 RepID=UPI00138C3388|nr:CPBP family intramembrane glutamic endopeptidase [Edaphobacter sp. 12200R-103]QHS50585.1 CPBP family intramembrane metalloprotease [Edaphobacter sp. 12200R-103]
MSQPATPPQPDDLHRDLSQPQAPADVAMSPNGEAIVIQAPPPSDARGPGVPARVPHIGHAILFVALTFLLLMIAQVSLLGLAHPVADPHRTGVAAAHPKLLIAAEAVSYVLTLAASWLFFPLLWQRSFSNGIQWNFATARRNAFKLIPIGLLIGFIVQALSSLIPVPKSIPMDDFFRTSSDVWVVAAFGTLLAPMFEEIAFRGFLFPAFAIAYDWLCLPRTPAAHEHWRNTTNLTLASIIFSAILSSIFFALIHGQQLGHTWIAVFVLFCVSLVLTAVRVRTRSVASSALVHASYNLSVFLTMFIATGGFRHLERLAR